METLRQVQLLFEDCYQNIDAHGDPDLRLDSVGRRAEKALDMEILLDPLEEQFHLPPAFVKQGNAHGRQGKVVRQVDEEPLRLGVEIADTTQPVWISLLAVEYLQANDLIGAHASGEIHFLRQQPHILEGALGASDEESAQILKSMQALEIQITAVHDIKRSGFYGNQIQGIDVVQLAVADMDKGWNWTTQIQQRVQLDGSLGPSELGPAKQIQAQVDGCGVERVGRGVQICGHGFVGVQATRFADQCLRQLRIDTPIPLLVGIGQGTAPNGATKPHLVKAIGAGAQTIDSVAQAVAKGQLTKGHAQELVPAGEAAEAFLTAEAIDASMKNFGMNQTHQLSKDRAAGIHPPMVMPGGSSPIRIASSSNRSHSFRAVTCHCSRRFPETTPL